MTMPTPEGMTKLSEGNTPKSAKKKTVYVFSQDHDLSMTKKDDAKTLRKNNVSPEEALREMVKLKSIEINHYITQATNSNADAIVFNSASARLGMSESLNGGPFKKVVDDDDTGLHVYDIPPEELLKAVANKLAEQEPAITVFFDSHSLVDSYNQEKSGTKTNQVSAVYKKKPGDIYYSTDDQAKLSIPRDESKIFQLMFRCARVAAEFKDTEVIVEHIDDRVDLNDVLFKSLQVCPTLIPKNVKVILTNHESGKEFFPGEPIQGTGSIDKNYLEIAEQYCQLHPITTPPFRFDVQRTAKNVSDNLEAVKKLDEPSFQKALKEKKAIKTAEDDANKRCSSRQLIFPPAARKAATSTPATTTTPTTFNANF